MARMLTQETLVQENKVFSGTAGVSARQRTLGSWPAFRDEATGRVYLSRFADGHVSPVHMLDGLPAELIVTRTRDGAVAAVRTSVVAGFVHDQRFYTREQAAHELKALSQ